MIYIFLYTTEYLFFSQFAKMFKVEMRYQREQNLIKMGVSTTHALGTSDKNTFEIFGSLNMNINAVQLRIKHQHAKINLEVNILSTGLKYYHFLCHGES